ncbi:hypothetical protein I3760_05G078300 [Carya illinoinensis]|nr:hypothetical protein I3760_05G078300 [Carya illinoinensis]
MFIFTSLTISSHFNLSPFATFTSNGSMAHGFNPILVTILELTKLWVDPLSTKRVISIIPTHAITLIDVGLGTPEMAFKDNSASSSDSLDSALSCSNSSLDVSSCVSSSTSLVSSSSNTYACPALHLCSLLHLSPHLKQRPFFILSWTSSLDIFFTS